MRRYTSFFFIAFLLAGCGRTEITREGVTQVPGTPYHKILICMISADPAKAAQMESIMSHRLKKHHMVGDRCTDIFPSLRGESPEQAVANIQAKDYDGVMIIQRKPVPPYLTLLDFVNAYEKGISTPPKTTDTVEGVASIIAVRENQPIWMAEGMLYGDYSTPPTTVLKAFASSMDDTLEDAGIFPDK